MQTGLRQRLIKRRCSVEVKELRREREDKLNNTRRSQTKRGGKKGGRRGKENFRLFDLTLGLRQGGGKIGCSLIPAGWRRKKSKKTKNKS